MGVAAKVGPRVVVLRVVGGPNVFAELGSLGIDLDSGDSYTFYGGHRLWVAPERPAITYTPDDGPVVLTRSGAAVSSSDPTGPFAKDVTVALQDGLVRVEHRMRNNGSQPASVAAWAITQLQPGGIAYLPVVPVADDAYQPDRIIVAWPYAEWTDPLIELDRDEMRLLPNRSNATKFGTRLGAEPLRYDWGALRFTKWVEPVEPATYGDLGANAQIYANDRFVELETLSPMVRLHPGESITHTERWTLEEI